jgi:predicted ATPase
MDIFENIHVRGFRRLHDVHLKLKSLNVVIGANSSGKTSLLDVFSMLAGSASGNLNETMSDLGGIDSNLMNLNDAKADKTRLMAFDLAMSVPNHSPIEYHIAMSLLRVARR